MVYVMGLEPTHVQKMVCPTQGSGTGARGTARYGPPVCIRCSLFKEIGLMG